MFYFYVFLRFWNYISIIIYIYEIISFSIIIRLRNKMELIQKKWLVNCLCNNIFFFHLQARDRFKSSTLFAFHWIFMLANNCWKGIYLILIFLISDTCPMGTFLCQNTTICLPQKNWCDQEIQCPYGDDEQNCCRFIIFIFHLFPQKKESITKKIMVWTFYYLHVTLLYWLKSIIKPLLSRSRNKLNLKFSYDVMTFLYAAHLLLYTV